LLDLLDQLQTALAGRYAVVPEITREVDHGHAAVPDLALDRIAARQRGL